MPASFQEINTRSRQAGTLLGGWGSVAWAQIFLNNPFKSPYIRSNTLNVVV